jgi:uncharacterized membrane protein
MTEDPLLENVRVVGDLERQAVEHRSRLDRFADSVTAFAGSGRFLVGHIVWFTVWLILGQSRYAFDPFPFSLLNVLVSVEAIFLTTFVLMTQNRMSRQADRRAHLDLQVNLLAEQELTAILQMLYALCRKAGTCARVSDTRVQKLLQKTDVIQLAMTLEKELTSE